MHQARLTAAASGGKRQGRLTWMACHHHNPELDDVPTKTEQTPERWRKRAGNTSGGAKPGWLDPSGCEGQNVLSFNATNDLLSRQGPQGEPCQKLQRALDTSTVSAGGPAGERHHPPLRNDGAGDHWPALEKTKVVSAASWAHHRRGADRLQRPPVRRGRGLGGTHWWRHVLPLLDNKRRRSSTRKSWETDRSALTAGDPPRRIQDTHLNHNNNNILTNLTHRCREDLSSSQVPAP